MSFLTINGFELPLAAEIRPSALRDTIGAGLTRAVDTGLRNNWNAKKGRFKGTTKPMTQAEINWLRALLDGDFDHWMWDSNIYGDNGLISDKGNAPTVNSVLDASAEGGPFSGDLSIGATGAVAYGSLWDSNADNGGTIMVSRFESGAWHDYMVVLSYNGTIVAKYKDGAVLGSSISSWFSSGSGTITIANSGGSPVLYAELVFVRAQLPASLVTQAYNFRNPVSGGRPWASPQGGAYSPGDGVNIYIAPILYAKGDFSERAMGMLGAPGEAGLVFANLDGNGKVWNNAQLAFELSKV